MSMRLVDHPLDRPAFLRETIDLVAARLERERVRLLGHVARASDEELGSGTDDAWGLGQIAVHLLVVERGMLGIALRLARGEDAGPTGQPRPDAGRVSREGIAALAERAAGAVQRLRTEFPAEPDTSRTAPSPYYGPLNCFGWLLASAFHYLAHLEALERGTKSAL